MSDRVDRLLEKAEAAADAGDIDQADMYRVLADQAAFHAKREVKALKKLFAMTETEEN